VKNCTIVAALIDTNVLVYAVSDDRKGERARTLLEEDYVLSVQALNEFALAGRRKLDRPWAEVHRALDIFTQRASRVVPLDLAVHRLGLRLSEQYKFAVYGGFMVAAALTAECDILWSEDMHSGLLVDGKLTITNPFA